MEFITDIYEARMTRNAEDQKILTYTDCCERTYLSLLILLLLNQYPTYRQYASKYSKDTRRTNYKNFRMHSTDLHNFVYFVQGDDQAMDKLKEPDSAKALRKRASFPTLGFNRFLMELQTGMVPSSTQALFMSVETGLSIKNTDYKVVRRNLFDYARLSNRDKKTTVTRLVHASRAKLRNSDIIEFLEKLSSDRNLETGSLRDAEPKISMPDISTQGRDLALYRYLLALLEIL